MLFLSVDGVSSRLFEWQIEFLSGMATSSGILVHSVFLLLIIHMFNKSQFSIDLASYLTKALLVSRLYSGFCLPQWLKSTLDRVRVPIRQLLIQGLVVMVVN